MEFTYQTKGVCSHTIRFEVVDGVVHNVETVSYTHLTLPTNCT